MRLQRNVVSFFASLVAIYSVAFAQGNSAVPPLPGSPGAVFVPLAPCRILNTLTDVGGTVPARAAGHVDIRTTRCGRIVPAYAIGYALTTVSYSHTPPEKLPPGRGRTEHDTVLPVQSNHLIDFTMPSDAEVAIDIYGYFVPAGTPITPTGQALGDQHPVAAKSATAVTAQGIGGPVAKDVVTGDKGKIYLDASVPGFGETGVLLTTPNTSFPWIVARTPTSDAASGFYLFNPGGPYLLARSDGALQLFNGSFLDGRTDYFGVLPTGTVSRDNHSVGVPTNIVHDVTLVNPRDLNGGNGQRVIFYNAKTEDENGSPDVTKFQAYTTGFAGTQKHINFDSQIYSHPAGNQFYHFRAYSAAEVKDTFWVKPATSGTDTAGTRADMYVSGNIGIASPNMAPWGPGPAIEGPTSAIEFGNLGDLHVASNAYQDNAGWKYKAAGPAANFYLYNGGFGWRVAGSGTPPNSITWTTPMTLDSSGLSVTGNANVSSNLNVGGTFTAGVIHATYQDVAEWVPATATMPAGTVVVVAEDANNTVTASTHAYDTSVAGVVSLNPGLLLGVASESKAKIATTGRVRVRVDATKSPIHKGDLLVTSDRPGMAMKSEPLDVAGVKLHRPGTLIGKALEPLAAGEGEILVLLSLQ
jgi:hypothetical protein